MGKRVQRAAAIVLGLMAAVLAVCVVLRAVRAERGAPVVMERASFSAAEGYAVIDLNSAAQEELQALPGIGETLAERIVQWREENGMFRTREDVLSVRGIGEATYEKIAPYITY